ncbi:MAG: hypothetical protein ACREVQ_11875 [Burkholderiales bacterium]
MTTHSGATAQQRLGQQLLGPLDDAVGLVRRYREVDAFRDYVEARLPLVVPACFLIAVAGIVLGLMPIATLIGTQAFFSLIGLILTPFVMAGCLFVLALVFFSWLEERSLARSLGHRAGPAPGRAARWVKRKLGADLGRAPRVPWLLAAVFVALPFALLARLSPAVALVFALVLAAAPIGFARLDR